MSAPYHRRLGFLLAVTACAVLVAMLAAVVVGQAQVGQAPADAGGGIELTTQGGDESPEAPVPPPSTYRDPNGLYELDLPPGWEVISEDDREARLRGPTVQSAISPAPTTAVLVIRAGTEDGRIWMCARLRCDDVKPKNTYDLARLLVGDERRAECALYRPCTTTRWTSLGGENAILVLRRSSTSLVVVREGRPSWLLWQDPLPDGMLARFRFLDGETESPRSVFTDPAGVYEVDVPEGWEVREQANRLVRLTGPSAELSIAAGTDDGLIRVCGSAGCDEAHPRTTEALARLLVDLAPISGPACQYPLRGCMALQRTSLDGDPAIRAFEHGVVDRGQVVLVHRGRPFVLSWQGPHAERLFEGFRFLDRGIERDYAWEGQLIRSPATGFEMRVPRFWSVHEEDGVLQLNGEGTSLTVRVGTLEGQLATCDRPDRPWERCRKGRITTLDEFLDAVAVGPPAGCGWCIPGGGSRATTLGGDEALEIAFYGYEYPARGSETALYVLAIHDGRPYFLRFHTSAEGHQDSRRALWSEILETFTFL
jgi:hypothetical protein